MKYDQAELSENANNTKSMLNRFENKLIAARTPSLQTLTTRALILVGLSTSGCAVANVHVDEMAKLKSSFSDVGLSVIAKNESEIELNVINKNTFSANKRQVIEKLAELYESNQLQVEPLFGLETNKGANALKSLSEEIRNKLQINDDHDPIDAPQNKM